MRYHRTVVQRGFTTSPRDNISYSNQTTTPCNKNAQNWYLNKSINIVKTTKNPLLRRYHMRILNYYYNGNAYAIFNKKN
jgi:hypothetical protein